jgi:hypothetical protein
MSLPNFIEVFAPPFVINELEGDFALLLDLFPVRRLERARERCAGRQQVGDAHAQYVGEVELSLQM